MVNSMNELTQRQILVNLGNRWAVLATNLTLPGDPKFTPTDGASLKRVADESDVAERRIYETLKVSDAEVIRGEENSGFDLKIRTNNGREILVEIKVLEHEPNRKDYDAIFKRLGTFPRDDELPREIWVFNIERLKLHTYYRDDKFPQHVEFAPVNVWEYGGDGSAFERKRVVTEVEVWVKRLDELYSQISEWTKDIEGAVISRTRSVEMSEELMQKFSVADRELAVLDIVRGAEPIASFVPRGLWLLGAHGWVDIITRRGTRALINLGREQTDWQLAGVEDRRKTTRFDHKGFLEILGDA
ncbi:hypothetical protein AB7645_38155 [Bradyrhizobium sp. 956_D2_N1_5]|uniref:hypothetical protein n=1 Tax=unclassified Bradyrhizobium TaxID=2631580 RepID=UPI003F2259CE